MDLNYCVVLFLLHKKAYLECIDPHCGLKYDINSTNITGEKKHFLDVQYEIIPSNKLKY